MYCSDQGFAVFMTEAARDAAVRAVEAKGGFQFKYGDEVATIGLAATENEPETVLWQNMGQPMSVTSAKLFKGLIYILCALIFWAVVFYGPYAWAVFTWNYDNGQQPGVVYGMSFSMVVVIGNAIMYIISANVSEDVGFATSDDRE